MLDLEKKMDKRFLEAHHETANAIVQALDVNLLKKDIDDQIKNATIDLETKFDNIYGDRTTQVEDQLDK